MKPLERNNTLVSSVNNTTSFKMKTSRETFEIFSSQIYEHKIRAIIRELSCNAYDAHVDAGKREQPFRIHFPTVFEPYFEVQDFGVGLDDYDIRGEENILYNEKGEEVSRYMEGGIYTTYFASTKRDSNESIGHLGLGSKSPLSYTKSMTIVARKAGVERHYVCFIGENGEPQTTINSVKDTDKSNGVSIRFSVAQDDFEEFRDEARFVLAMFKIKPEININIEEYKLNESELSSILNDGSLIIDDNHPFHNHEPAHVYCNMGGVVYPVRNLSYIYMSSPVLVNEDAYNTGEDDTPEYYEFKNESIAFIRTMINRDKRFIINYPLGDLSFMPSREGLSQDTQTKFNFYKQLVEVVGKEIEELQTTLDKSRQPLEAINQFAKFTDPWDRLANRYYFQNKEINSLINDRAFKDIRTDITDDDKFICHSKEKRRDLWYSNDTVIRRKNMFGYNLFDLFNAMITQNSFVCYYANDADEYKGMTKAIHFYMNEKPIGEKVFFFYEAGCKTTVFKKFKDVFYGNVEFRHISRMVDEVKAIEPSFFEKKKKDTTKAPKVRASKKNETKAVVYTRLDKDRYKSSDKKVIIDLSKLNPNTSMYIDKVAGNFHLSYVVRVFGGRNKHFTNNTLYDYMKALGIKTCIVADGLNKKRIDKAGIKPMSVLIENYLTNNKDNILETRILSRGISHAIKGLVDQTDTMNIIETQLRRSNMYNRGTFLYLYDNDDGYTKSWCDDYVRQVQAFIQLVPNDDEYREIQSLFGDFFEHLSEDDLEKSNELKITEKKLGELFESIIAGVQARYPLLFGVDSDKAAVLEYVQLVNAKYNQLKEVA